MRLPPLLVSVLLLLASQTNAGCPDDCRCKEPTEVVCISQSLTSVPPCTDCKDILYLDLSHNDIQELSSIAFKDYPNLKRLFLNYNEIHSIDTLAFSELRDLQENKINKNNLTQINPNTLDYLTSLNSLSLRDNPLVITSPFLSSDTLTYLELSGCQLKYLPNDSFSFLTELEYIMLENNELTELPYNIFNSLKQLKNVYLHGNPWRCGGYLEELMTERPELIADLKKVKCVTVDNVRAGEKQVASSTVSSSQQVPVTLPAKLPDTSSSNKVVGFILLPSLASLLLHVLIL